MDGFLKRGSDQSVQQSVVSVLIRAVNLLDPSNGKVAYVRMSLFIPSPLRC